MNVQVILPSIPDDGEIRYIAAKAAHRNTSYTGSALPYFNMEQAMDGTRNKGRITGVYSRNVTIKLREIPGAFYANLGTTRIEPSVFIFYKSNGEDKKHVYPIKNAIPFRSLTYPEKRKNTMFYDRKNEVRSQEQILMSSGYNIEINDEKDFWGGKPPM